MSAPGTSRALSTAVGWARDTRYAWRLLRRSPAYVAAVIATLALAIGANLAVFCIADALWLRPLPVSAPERVGVLTRPIGQPDEPARRGGRERDESDTFKLSERDTLTEVKGLGDVATELAATDLTADFRPRLRVGTSGPAISGTLVSSNYFRVLGVPLIGSGLVAEDDRPGTAPAAVISYRLWRAEFDADRHVVGRSVNIGGRDVVVRAVAPEGFTGPLLGQSVDMWLGLGALQSFGASPDLPIHLAPFRLFARLRPGSVRSDAEGQATAALGVDVRLRTLAETRYAPRDRGRAKEDGALLGFLSMVAVLIFGTACLNLASLLVSRFDRRQQEIDVRLALGLSPAGLIRLLLAEPVVLGLGGLAGAFVVFRVFLATIARFHLPTGLEIGNLLDGMNWRVAGVTSGVSLVAVAGFASWPAWRAIRPGASSTGRVRGLSRVHSLVLVGQVALSMVLLVGSTLLIRSVLNVFNKDYGFAVNRVVSLVLQPSLGQYWAGGEGIAQRRHLDYERLIESLRSVPGVAGVSVGASPLGDGNSAGMPSVTSLVVDGERREIRLRLVRAGSGYFAVTGVAVQAGRGFGDVDLGARAATTCVVSESLAARLWGARSCIGRRIAIDSWGSRLELQVVGQVRDAVRSGIRANPDAVLYLPTGVPDDLAQPMLGLVIRTGTEPAVVQPQILAVVQRSFPYASQLKLEAASDQIAAQVTAQRLGLRLFVWFGAVALLLGLMGAYGVAANIVERRQRELGIRLALGAQPPRLLAEVVWRTAALVGAGLAAGWVISSFASTAFSRFVFGISSLDMLSYGTAALVVASGAIGATVAGAWRIRSIDPVAILRRE
jgi:macrolide transport system ATP-binding/permease protein